MRLGYYICGGVGNINCPYWDDIHGCWHDEKDAFTCKMFIELESESLEEEQEDEDYE